MAAEYRWGVEQRSLFDRYRAIVVASRFMRDEYLRAGVAPASVHAIPLFAPPHVAGRRVSTTARVRSTSCFSAGMTTLKGPDILVEAAAHASARLGRPGRRRLRRRRAGAGSPARAGGGARRRRAVPRLADAARARSVAARDVHHRRPEPLGRAVRPGRPRGRRRSGTPAVAFDVGGIADWLTDRENGRLIGPTRGAAGLGDAIAEILANPELWRRLAAGARAAAARFSLDNHLRLLTPVLGRGGRVRRREPVTTWHLLTPGIPAGVRRRRRLHRARRGRPRRRR